MNNFQGQQRSFPQGSRSRRKGRRRQPRPGPAPYTGLTYKHRFDHLGVQWLDMTTPAFSSNAQIDTLTLATRLNASRVHWSAGTFILRITTPVDTVTTYRVLLLHLVNRYVMTGSWDPITYLTPQATTTNFVDVVPYVPRDQAVRYRIIEDRQFVVDTHYGNTKLVSQHEMRIPAHDVDYDPDDADGLTGLGLMVVLVLTDATHTNASYLHGDLLLRNYRICF